MADMFEAYKPLRNHLRKVELLDSLGVIRAYVQHLQFGTPFPHDIEVPAWFLQASDVGKHVFEWELDILVREVLINADSSARYGGDTLRRFNYLAGAVNKLKDLENSVAGINPEGSILLELHRIAHRQFPWQRGPTRVMMGRYYRIFSRVPLEAILKRKLGLTAKELYRLGLVVSAIYLDTFALTYPPKIEIPGLNLEKLDRILSHFAIPMVELREKARASQELNENYAYVFNPLRIHPLVWIERGGRREVICPIPTFLLWRFTEGVFYELLHEPGFSDAYGEAFQDHVGVVIDRAKSASLTVYPEVEYYVGKDRRDSVDWLIEDEGALLFVESKTKRLQLKAKTEIRTVEALEAELEKLASFIVQVYKTIGDYEKGYYPHVSYRPGKPVFPLVLTLEEWFAFGTKIGEVLEERVGKKCAETGLPATLLTERPYAVCSMADFEVLVQVIAKRSIAEVIGKKAGSAEHKKWLFHAYLSTEYPEEYRVARDLFPEVIEELTVVQDAGQLC